MTMTAMVRQDVAYLSRTTPPQLTGVALHLRPVIVSRIVDVMIVDVEGPVVTND